MTLLDLARSRRSQRAAFLARPVSDEDVEYLAEAARWAPSPFNVQPWALLFVTEQDAKAASASENGEGNAESEEDLWTRRKDRRRGGPGEEENGSLDRREDDDSNADRDDPEWKGDGEDGSRDVVEEGRDPELVVSPETEQLLVNIGKAIDLHRFADAAKAARKLAGREQGLAKARARQLLAKATLFQRLLPEGTQKPPALREIRQANGATLVARKIEETFDSYKISLISGGFTILRKEDVLEVRDAADSAEYRKKIAEKLEKTVVRYDEPIDLFLRGVKRYYRLGLRSEGLALMEKLLEMDDGVLVLSILGANESEELVPEWRLARGRAVEVIEQRAAERARVRTQSRDADASLTGEGDYVASAGGNGGTGGSRGRAVTDDDLRRENAGVRPTAPAGSVDQAEFRAVLKKVGDANRIFQRAIQDGSRSGDFKRAAKMLKEVQTQLQNMPQTDQVRELGFAVARKRHDIYKASPFE